MAVSVSVGSVYDAVIVKWSTEEIGQDRKIWGMFLFCVFFFMTVVVLNVSSDMWFQFIYHEFRL